MPLVRAFHHGAQRNVHEMRHLRFHHRLLLTAAAALSTLAACRTVPEPPVDPLRPVVHAEILRWKNGADAAVSLTFDDSTLDHYLLAAPELDRRGMTATFFVITGLMDVGFWEDGPVRRRLFGWNQARDLAARGHEIGSHTHSHPDLSRIAPHLADRELLRSYRRIRQEIPNRSGLTFAWPYWRSTDRTQVLASRYYIAARGGQATTARYRSAGPIVTRPDNLLHVNALGVRPVETAAVWQEAAEDLLKSGGWAVLSLHGIDDGRIPRDALGWEALPIETYRQILDYLRAEDIWIAPFATVVKYIERRDATRLVVEQNGAELTINVYSPLDPATYDIPLTVALHFDDSSDGSSRNMRLQLAPRVRQVTLDMSGATPVVVAAVTDQSTPAAITLAQNARP